MNFFKEKQLFRIEIIKKCPVMSPVGFERDYRPSSEALRIGTLGCIPVGIKGWIIEKWGKKYFSPDENQLGLDLFTPVDQPYVLISYNKVNGFYKEIF
jgi:hypothetical protein